MKKAGHTIPSCTIHQIPRQDSRAACGAPNCPGKPALVTRMLGNQQKALTNTWMLQGEQQLKLCVPAQKTKSQQQQLEFQATAWRNNFWGWPEPQKEKAKRVRENVQWEFRCSAGIAGGQEQLYSSPLPPELGDCQPRGRMGVRQCSNQHSGVSWIYSSGKTSCWIPKEAFVLRFWDSWAALAEPL